MRSQEVHVGQVVIKHRPGGIGDQVHVCCEWPWWWEGRCCSRDTGRFDPRCRSTALWGNVAKLRRGDESLAASGPAGAEWILSSTHHATVIPVMPAGPATFVTSSKCWLFLQQRLAGFWEICTRAVRPPALGRGGDRDPQLRGRLRAELLRWAEPRRNHRHARRVGL